jgi:hypothetical protein
MKYTFGIILTLNILSIFTSQIATNLWTKEFLGKPHSIRFANSEELILSTTKGIISKINANTGEEIWKKNMIYDTKYELESNIQCI